MRAASNDAERAAVFEDAGRVFAGEPAVLEFLKTLAPSVAGEETVCGRSDSPAFGWRRFSSIMPRR